MVNAEKKKVTLTGGAPWGFRLTGGGSLPLTVNKIRKKSQAAMQGLREGDAVLSINGEHVYDKTQDEALELVDKSGKFLTLEIFRGDIGELGQDKPKKTIQVPSSGNAEGAITISATVDSASSGSRTQVDTSSELIMTASVDNVTSDSFDTADSELSLSGFKLTATVDDVSGTTFDPLVSSDTTSGFTISASVDDVTSSSNAVLLESSPVISAEVGDISSSYVEDIQASTTLPTVMAEPFVDSQPKAPSPIISANTNNNIRYSPRGPSTSPKPPKSNVSPKPPQAYSPQPQTTLSPQPQQNRSPQPPATFSPQPQQNLSPQPPATFSPQPPASFSPQPQQTRSPQPPPSFSPQFQQNRSPQPPPNFSPQPVQTYSPQPPAVSPKPQRIVSPQAPPVSPKPPGVTSNVTSATFDDGQTRREVTREQYVQRSDDGSSSTVVEQETTTTNSFARPNFVKNQASAFNAVQPSSVQQQKRSTTTTTTTLQSTSNITNQKGPAPFVGSTPPSWQTSEFQTSNVNSSRSTGNLSGNAPVFKPSRFVPGSSKKEIPGLYTPTSPMVDVSVNAMYKQGKENVAPQPMFQVKNIVSDKAKTQGRETWRPNMWLPGQQPSKTYEEPSMVTTSKDDFSPYSSFPVPKIRPGYSLVEEQKRKLLETQTSRMTDYSDYYEPQDYADSQQHHHKHGRLHVFAPPVEIHADSGYPESPYSPYEEHYIMDDEDALSSPNSLRKRNIYSDSAFYDTPGKSYPTITEQMKLCKKIAQSLTSAANKRARGAKMFMKRKRKSSKWVHEGHSEWSSSAGDVANIHDLDSELSPDEGGNKPLLYFKIPNLKNRVGNEAKQTKMALTQEQFEKLRLHSKKCEHKAVAPDTCFDIVADLKAHKGRGGRMFERRKQRSDKYIIEESRYAPPQKKLEAVLSQPVRQEKTPWEAAMEHGGNVDAAFSHLTEWERNQKLNQILKNSPPRKLQTTPMAPVVQAAPLPAVRSSLRSSDSPHLLKGKDFNRTARGWAGGGEYPVADHMHHVSPTRQLGPSQSTQSFSQQQNYNNKIKAWQGPGESPYVQIPGQERQQDQWDARRQDNWQARRQDDWRSQEWSDPRQDMHNGHFEYQAPRPKSWQPDSYDGHSYREEIDYTYAPVDYRFMPSSSDYPKAYQQPIVPGTDL